MNYLVLLCILLNLKQLKSNLRKQLIRNLMSKQIENILKAQSPRTHQTLIRRMKLKLKLPIQESTFISRSNILEYIRKLHQQSSSIRSTLNPPSVQKELKELEQQCSLLKQTLDRKQVAEKQLTNSILLLDDEIHFMEDQLAKNKIEVEYLQKQIQLLEEQKENSDSHLSQTEHVSVLMDKFINYFQQEEGSHIASNFSNKNSSLSLFNKFSIGERQQQLAQSKASDIKVQSYMQSSLEQSSKEQNNSPSPIQQKAALLKRENLTEFQKQT